MTENSDALEQTETKWWFNAKMVRMQLEGLLMGYNASTSNLMDFAHLLFINADGEIPELLDALGLSYQRFRQTKSKNFKETKESLETIKKKDPDTYWELKMLHSHCTLLCKLKKNENGSIEDLLVGHTTWDDYSEMLRIWKYQDLTKIGSISVSFSSYPGCITSTDDWYVLSSGLLVTETTLEIMSNRLQKRMMPANRSVPNFVKI